MQPTALPASVLARSDVREAIQNHDFGRLFFLARKWAGISYSQIAEACEIKPSRVGELARNSGAITTLAKIEKIADCFRIPGHLLRLAPRPWETDTHPRAREQDHETLDDDMNRRSLLAVLAAGGVTAVSELSTTRHELDAALSPSDGDLSYWEETADRYGYGYGGRSPVEVLPDLTHDLTEVRTVLGSTQTASRRARLCRVVGRLAGDAAIMLHDLGEHRESTRWFYTAERAAAEAQDTTLQSWILARAAMIPLNWGAAALAVTISQRATALLDGRATAEAALALAVAARSHAASGNRASALEAITAVERLVDRLPAGEQADTWYGYPAQKHHVHLSQALTLIGETGRAADHQAAALRLTTERSVMSRALIVLDQAMCMALNGQVSDAVELAVHTYQDLPPAHRQGLVRSRADLLKRRVGHGREAAPLRAVLADTSGRP